MKIFLKFYLYYFLLFLINSFRQSIIRKKGKKFGNKKYNKNNKLFHEYLNKNKIFNSENKISKNIDGKILITDFVSVSSYTLSTSTIGKYASKILNKEIYGVVRDGDSRGAKIINSFGASKVFYLKNENLLKKIFFYFKAVKLLKKINNVDDFLNIKVDGTNLGLSVYDHLIRHTRRATFDKLNFKFYYFTALALEVNEYCKNLFKKNKFDYAVISETQFIPGSLFFENALLNDCKVLAHEGSSNIFTLKLYCNINERFSSKVRFPKNILNNILKKKSFLESSEGKKLIIEKMKVNQLLINKETDFKNEGEFSKKKICEIYGWDINKPIICIFGHDFIDGNFNGSWRIFKDKITWFYETLEYACKKNEANWIIKEHPVDNTGKPIITARSVYNKLCLNNNNIKFLDEKLTSLHLINSLDLVTTCSGSVGLEFPCFGIPALIAAESYYNDFGFTIEPKNKKDYFKVLDNILLNIKNYKLTSSQINIALVYAFISYSLGYNKCPLIPYYYWSRKKFDENKFWADSMNLLENYDFSKDSFYKNLSIQLNNNFRNMISDSSYLDIAK